jgi:hypothetical protein
MGDHPKGSLLINFIMLHKLPMFLDGSTVISTCLRFRAKVYVHHVLCAKIFNVFFVLSSIGLRLNYFGVQWQVDHNGECNKSKCRQSTLHCVHRHLRFACNGLWWMNLFEYASNMTNTSIKLYTSFITSFFCVC